MISFKPVGNSSQKGTNTSSCERNYSGYFKTNSYPSMVIPTIRVLLKSWEKENDDRGVQTMKNEMMKSVKDRFTGIEDNYLLSVATIVDPRFKDRFFSSNISKSIAKEAAQKELRKVS